ncbi:hypothetical protein C8J56DRAFT_799626 [Mycena floridula]|nr:hypothetical protein C8J56DRAFT_799626 [Mycena floridula]
MEVLGRYLSHSRSLLLFRSQSEPNDICQDDEYQRDIIRKAVSILCSSMEPRLLRKSEPGGERTVDPVEIRLRALLKLQRRWMKTDVSPAEEQKTFAEALQDGYVLCQ